MIQVSAKRFLASWRSFSYRESLLQTLSWHLIIFHVFVGAASSCLACLDNLHFVGRQTPPSQSRERAKTTTPLSRGRRQAMALAPTPLRSSTPTTTSKGLRSTGSTAVPSTLTSASTSRRTGNGKSRQRKSPSTAIRSCENMSMRPSNPSTFDRPIHELILEVIQSIWRFPSH